MSHNVTTAVDILGSGAVARALGGALRAAGWDVRFRARSEAQHAELRALFGEGTATLPVHAPLEPDRALLFCVSDRAIEELAVQLAGAAPASSVALHTSGYHGHEALAALAERGWETGSVHPLRAVVREPSAAASERALQGAWFACEGSDPARALARSIVDTLDGQVLDLPPGTDAKVRYHAAASLFAGGLVALLDTALELFGDDSPRSREAFTSLATGALAHAARLGPAQALTGPAARGEAQVINGHLTAIQSSPTPEATALYTWLTRRMLALAIQNGALSPESARKVEEQL